MSGQRTDLPLYYTCSDLKGDLKYFELSYKVPETYPVSLCTWLLPRGSAGESLGDHFAKPKDTTVYMDK